MCSVKSATRIAEQKIVIQSYREMYETLMEAIMPRIVYYNTKALSLGERALLALEIAKRLNKEAV